MFNRKRVRVGTAVAAVGAALVLATGCSDDKDEDTDKADGGASATAPAQPSATGAPAGSGGQGAAPSPGKDAGDADDDPAKDFAGVGVCDPLPAADVQRVLGLPSVTSKPDSLPFTCRYDGPDGKEVLSVIRSQLPILDGETAESEVAEVTTEKKGEPVADVGTPATYYQEMGMGSVMFAKKHGDLLVNVTLTPLGSARATDRAKLVELAKVAAGRL